MDQQTHLPTLSSFHYALKTLCLEQLECNNAQMRANLSAPASTAVGVIRDSRHQHNAHCESTLPFLLLPETSFARAPMPQDHPCQRISLQYVLTALWLQKPHADLDTCENKSSEPHIAVFPATAPRYHINPLARLIE